MELNVSGEIWSFAQEEEPPGLSDWHLQQVAAKNMTRMHLMDVIAISVSFIDTLTFKLNGDSRITAYSHRTILQTHSTGFVFGRSACTRFAIKTYLFIFRGRDKSPGSSGRKYRNVI
jgi:hypothetical protein